MDRYRREQEIFDAALEIEDAARRAAYLKGACGGDEDLRAGVEALLAALDAAGEDATAAALPAGVGAAAAAPSDQPPEAGNYRVFEAIGEGGMGTVFRAEQTEPVERMVALKVVRSGLDTAEIVARFEAERQAIARMDHPGIATVFDAGSTRDGLPFFVMELVEGTPVTAYCDREKLTLRERIGIFLDICGAVQHAHQKGVVHRDLKPGNILVSHVDGRPVPKVIDFGIAKATDPARPAGAERSGDDATPLTRANQIVGTPGYMAPEQIERPGEVDARADGYALGALLFELLTGAAPHGSQRLNQLPLEEALRVICTETPPRPSQALTRARSEGRVRGEGDRGEAVVREVAARRGTDPGRLAESLRGDLDWITLKALEAAPERRYDNAAALADDLRRHLANEPVSAAPPGSVYRVRKFVRRYRGTVLAATSAAAALLVAAAASTAMFSVADAARRGAADARMTLDRQVVVTEGTRARAERLLAFMLDDVHRDLEADGRLGLLAGTAAKAWQHYRNLPAGADARPPQERLELAGTLARIADITSVRGTAEPDTAGPTAPTGPPADAGAVYRLALGLVADESGVHRTAIPAFRRQRAAIYARFGHHLDRHGKPSLARAALHNARDLYLFLARRPGATPDDRTALAGVFGELSTLCEKKGQTRDALRYAQLASATLRTGDDTSPGLDPAALGRARHREASLRVQLGQTASAEAALRDALFHLASAALAGGDAAEGATQDTSPSPASPHAGERSILHRELARLLLTHNPEAAVEELQAAARLLEAPAGAGRDAIGRLRQRADTETERAAALVAAGRTSEALTAYQAARNHLYTLRRHQRENPEWPRRYAEVTHRLADLLARLGRRPEAALTARSGLAALGSPEASAAAAHHTTHTTHTTHTNHTNHTNHTGGGDSLRRALSALARPSATRRTPPTRK